MKKNDEQKVNKLKKEKVKKEKTKKKGTHKLKIQAKERDMVKKYN